MLWQSKKLLVTESFKPEHTSNSNPGMLEECADFRIPSRLSHKIKARVKQNLIRGNSFTERSSEQLCSLHCDKHTSQAWESPNSSKYAGAHAVSSQESFSTKPELDATALESLFAKQAVTGAVVRQTRDSV